MDKKVGHYSFIIGVIIALILGLFSGYLGSAAVWLASLLVVLGLIVGFLNVAGSETKEFLLVAVVLIIAAGVGSAGATLSGIELIGQYISGIFTQVLAFVVPATVVVALKDIFRLAQNK